MNFRSVKDMSDIIRNKLTIIPRDVELIVGIPRSGMLPATLLSVYLNLPLVDSMSLLSDTSHAASSRDYRISGNKNSTNIRDYRKILVIDDSCNTGLSIEEVKKQIDSMGVRNTEVLYACVYVSPQAVSFVDLYFEIVPQPRVFEWNIMNHAVVQSSFFDMDGILCEDPTDEENDDGDKYINFILNAKPLYIPKLAIGAIVTSRLEKYRCYTEEWLKKHNVKYQHLVMLNLKTKEERIRLGAHASFKANVYSANKGAVLFIESDPQQAKYINNATGKAVYCPKHALFLDSNGEKTNEHDPQPQGSVEKFASEMHSIVNKLETVSNQLVVNSDELDYRIVSSVADGYNELISILIKEYPSYKTDESCKVVEELFNAIDDRDSSVVCDRMNNLPQLCRNYIETVKAHLQT